MEVKKLEELYKSTQGLQTLSEKLNKCTIELKWAYVKEIEQVNNVHGYNVHTYKVYLIICNNFQ